MIAAVVLINTERGRIAETAEALLALPEVAEVYSVAGEYDLVAIVRVRAYEQMAEVVPTRLAAMPTISKTTTLMAFQCYSRRDLERMWGIGLDDESELGVFHDLFQPQRAANLRARLDEHTPAGMDAGIVYVN